MGLFGGGNKSSSNAVSNSYTTYNNTPQTVQDNGVALNNSNLITGQNNNSINGSTFNALDGGAIASAFGLGSELIASLFKSQKENNALISANNAAALNFAEKANAIVDKKVNAVVNEVAEKNAALTRNLMVAAAVAIAYFYFK